MLKTLEARRNKTFGDAAARGVVRNNTFLAKNHYDFFFFLIWAKGIPSLTKSLKSSPLQSYGGEGKHTTHRLIDWIGLGANSLKIEESRFYNFCHHNWHLEIWEEDIFLKTAEANFHIFRKTPWCPHIPEDSLKSTYSLRQPNVHIFVKTA